MKFCPECGKPLPVQPTKFCPECGASLQNLAPPGNRSPVPAPPSEQLQPQPGLLRMESQEHEGVQRAPEETELKPRVYDLGVKLEETTASILQKMGYTTQLRQHMPTRSGPLAEIDILLTRGNRRKAVECKNYDLSRAVGTPELRIFKSKLDDIGVASGLFVTSTYFSRDAEEFADSVGLERWDRDELREKYFEYAIGRVINPSLVRDPVLPISMGYNAASFLDIRNPKAINLYSAVLLYHPYILVKYRLHCERTDLNHKVHKILDEGTAVVDALDGDIINAEKGVIGGIAGLFKGAEERAESRNDKIVSEDLLSIQPSTQTIMKTGEYDVTVPETEVSEEEAIRLTKDYVVKKNTKTITYRKEGKDNLDIRTMKVVPRLNETTIRGQKLVYVPKWDIQYEAVQRSYDRRVVASSGRMIEDPLSKCGKCSLLKRPTVAICETCGKPLCDKHSVLEDGRWVCPDDSLQASKQESKLGGLFSKFKSLGGTE